MKRLSKTDSARKIALADALDVAHEKLDAALAGFNEKLTELWSPVADAIDGYNAVVADVNGFKSDIAGEIESYMDERSDKWREGDAASSYEEWKSAWEEDLEEAQIDEPEGIELPEISTGDPLRDLEDEVAL